MRSQRNSDGPWVPKPEKAEVLAAFAAHKDEVTAGYVAAAKQPAPCLGDAAQLWLGGEC
jgi:hypothetical protein